ncbi:hypothetical protein IJT10_06965 [bacterium]|nr:hypothetical protein [bacterium]
MKTNKILAATLVILASIACGPTINTTPQNYQIANQSVTFAPPPEDSWSKQKVDNSILVRYVNKNNDQKFLSIASVDMKEITSWSENPEKTKRTVRDLQDQILKRSDGHILKQKQIKLGGEDALQLIYTYNEGTIPTWGCQIYAFHKKKLWCLACSSPDAERDEAEAIIEHVVKTFKFN